ncbi:MAG: M13-type metalloendopeptidase [Terriglobales bacterium]
MPRIAVSLVPLGYSDSVIKRLHRNHRHQITRSPYSPPEFRVNGVVRNMDAWYRAFHVRPCDKLYVAPKDRVHIW